MNCQIFEGYPWEEGCEIVFIDPNSTYVVIKFELAKFFVEKVVNVKNSVIV